MKMHNKVKLLAAAGLMAMSSSAFATGPTIMALGDSITFGYGHGNPDGSATYVPGGYRDPLYTDLTNQGKSFQYVGTSPTPGPGVAAQDVNTSPLLTATGESAEEGKSGYRIDQINGDLNGNVTNTAGGPSYGNDDGGYWLSGGGGTGRAPIMPNIVLLHIGTNDSSQGASAGVMSARLVALLANLKATLPSTSQVFVASIIPRLDSPGLEAIDVAYNTLMVSDVANAGSQFHFVNMHDQFAAAQVTATAAASLLGQTDPFLQPSDGVHPTQDGYNEMATIWDGAIASRVPEPASLSVCAVAGLGLLSRRRRKN